MGLVVWVCWRVSQLLYVDRVCWCWWLFTEREICHWYYRLIRIRSFDCQNTLYTTAIYSYTVQSFILIIWSRNFNNFSFRRIKNYKNLKIILIRRVLECLGESMVHIQYEVNNADYSFSIKPLHRFPIQSGRYHVNNAPQYIVILVVVCTMLDQC